MNFTNADQLYLAREDYDVYQLVSGDVPLVFGDGPLVGGPKSQATVASRASTERRPQAVNPQPPNAEQDARAVFRPPKASRFVKGDMRDKPPNMEDKTILRGINVKWPFGGAIADEHKVEENRMHDLGSRGYDTGREYLLIQTPGFSKKQAASEILLDETLWRRRPDKAEIVAVIEFTSSRAYQSVADFVQGRLLSCIKETSSYNWKGGGDRFAWKVKVKYVFKTPIEVKTGETAPRIQITFDDETGASALHAMQSPDQVSVF